MSQPTATTSPATHEHQPQHGEHNAGNAEADKVIEAGYGIGAGPLRGPLYLFALNIAGVEANSGRKPGEHKAVIGVAVDEDIKEGSDSGLKQPGGDIEHRVQGGKDRDAACKSRAEGGHAEKGNVAHD